MRLALEIRSSIILALLCAAIVFASAMAKAAECKLEITRKACSGKETEAFAPYNSKVTTEEVFQLKNVELCLQKAKSGAKIVRDGIIAEKTVVVRFNGQLLEQKFADTQSCR